MDFFVINVYSVNMSKDNGRRRGRPTLQNPKRAHVNFRVDDEAKEALEKYRERLNVIGLSLSDAARDLLIKSLQKEGLLHN